MEMGKTQEKLELNDSGKSLSQKFALHSGTGLVTLGFAVFRSWAEANYSL